MFILKFIKKNIFPLSVISLGIVIMYIFEYKHMWTIGNKREIPSVCYVAVKNENAIKFVGYTELNSVDKVFFTSDVKINIKNNSWDLRNDNGVIIVKWRNDDLDSTFKYKVDGGKINPILCKNSNIGYLFSGLFYSFLIVSFIRIVVRKQK